MNSKEKQVEELLATAKQALDFFRTVLDDLYMRKDKLDSKSLNRLYLFQQNYKKHKAVLTNIDNLFPERGLTLPENFASSLTNHLRKRISLIVEDSIELDRLR